MTFKKILGELPMIGLGGGFAVAGASGVAIGIMGAKNLQNIYGTALLTVGGAWLAHAGYQVAAGAAERAMGKR